MTDEKIEIPEKSTMIITFTQGRDSMPTVKMTNHFNITPAKMQLAVGEMNKVFWNTVNRLGHENQKGRREEQAQRAAARLNPLNAKLKDVISKATAATVKTLQTEMTEN